jgi:signal transduction histidine kinase
LGLDVVKSAGSNKRPVDAALLEFILEAAGEGIVFVQSEKKIGYINQVAREMLRCARWNDPLPSFSELTTRLGFDPLSITPKDSAAGKSTEKLSGGPPAQKPAERSSLSQLSWQQEATLFGVPYVVRGSPVFTGPSSFAGTVLCFKDLRETQKREQIISENLSFASHELFTPITAIKNALDLLSGQKFGELSEKQLRFVQLASRNLERLNNVVTAILDLSQMETRILALHLEEVDVLDPLERALAPLAGLAQEKGIKLQKQLQDAYPKILADGDRLRQVVYNLVHNAIKFTPEGGNIYVGLEVVPLDRLSELLPKEDESKPKRTLDRESLLLTVADDGEGIPPAHLKSIFAKFHQGRGPSGDQNTRGRGLGLSIVKTMVEAHGGLVWVESDLGEGSTFRVMLPKLSRKTYLVQTVAARLERAKIVSSTLTLVIFRVVPKIGKPRSETQDGNLMADFLQLAVETGQSTVRLKSDTVEVLDASRGVFLLLAELDPKFASALLERFSSNLKKEAEKRGLPLTWQLKWGMASYPRDVSTAAELVATAIQAVSGAEAEVIDLQHS